MIIDFVNYTLYHPGAEASILFHLHEYGLRVPRFFCIPEQYEPEELDAYFAMHFQDVLQYHVWQPLSFLKIKLIEPNGCPIVKRTCLFIQTSKNMPCTATLNEF